VAITIFQDIFDIVNTGILATLNGKSAAIIGLISPIIGICFTIYLLLIAVSAMRGHVGGENIMDLLLRSIGWLAIITFGLNINYYMQVADFFNGLGASLSGALSNSPSTNSGAMLDGLVTQYVNTALKMWKDSSFPETIVTVPTILVLAISGAIMLAIAAAYILLAQIALGVLLVIGPIFIALAMFPATRKFFDSWIGQCVNYVLLTVLFNYLATIQADLIGKLFSNSMYTNNFILMPTISLIVAVVWILVALNMPSLASSLAGGVGISSMVGKPLSAAKEIAKALSKLKGKGSSSNNTIT